MKTLNRIKDALKEQNKTQSWLSTQIGISRTSISKWCNNEIQPNLSDLDKVAMAMNINTLSLITPNQPDKDIFEKYTLKFLKPYHVPSSIDGILFYFPYKLNDEFLYGIQVGISGSLAIGWGFQIWHPNANVAYKPLEKVLFQLAIKHLEKKILNRDLNEVEKLMYLTSNAPQRMPYDPSKLKDPNGQIHIVKLKKVPVDLTDHFNVHRKFYMSWGENFTGVLLIDQAEKYFVVKTLHLKEYQMLMNDKDTNEQRMKDLRYYVDTFEIINIKPVENN